MGEAYGLAAILHPTGSAIYFQPAALLPILISKHGLASSPSGLRLRRDVAPVEGYLQARGQERPRQPPWPAIAVVHLRYVLRSFALYIWYRI